MGFGGLYPAGEFFCRRCFCRRDFIVCEDASPETQEPPVECYVCGYTYDRNVREVDPDTGERMAPNLAIQPAINAEQRDEARHRMREKFKTAVLRDGARLENFSGLARRARGQNGER